MRRCVLVLLAQSLKVKHTANREKRMAKIKSEAFHERMLKKKKGVTFFFQSQCQSFLGKRMILCAEKAQPLHVQPVGKVWFASFQSTAGMND